MMIRQLFMGALMLAFAFACSSDAKDPDGVGVEDGATTETMASEGGTVDDGAPAGDTGSTPTDPQISQTELRRITAALADDSMNGRDEGTPGGEAARTFIIAELQKCGVQPAGDGGTFEQQITTGQGTNIIGKIEGSGSAAEKARHIVISAHYDHLGACGGQICNGADDNAAGVAIMIQVACQLAKKPPMRSVVIASWDAEEPPTFLSDAMGSAYWVANPTVPLTQLDASIVLDLAGGDLWDGFEGHFLLGAELSPEVGAALTAATKPAALEAYRIGLHLVEQTAAGHQPWSDYDAFRNQNIPVLFLTNGQNKRYHTAADELDTVNLPKMTLEAEYLLSLVQQLADRAGEAKPAFDSSGNDYARDAASLIPVLEAALDPNGLIKDLSSMSKAALQGDLDAAKAIKTTLDGGGTLTSNQVLALRSATQRIMCLAGGSYAELVCNLF